MTNKTENDNNYFNVEIIGDYFTATSMGNVIKPFGPVMLKMRDWTSCQMLARRHILPALISKADMEFKDIRRCIVLGVYTQDKQPVHGLPVKFMSREQIKMEARSNNIPLRVDIYPDVVQLRGKLKMARNNPDKFKEMEQRTIRAFDKIGDALTINADVFNDIKNEQLKKINLSLNSTAAGSASNIGKIGPTYGKSEFRKGFEEQNLPEVEVTGGPDGSGDELSDEDLGMDL